MRPVRLASALLALVIQVPAFAASGESPPPGVSITYVGNEGFLIEAPEGKVLIDALYGEGIPGYVVPPREVRRKVEGALPPFDGVDLVLPTHSHDDHFNPLAIGKHLAENPRASFISTEQSVERLRTSYQGYGAISDRVHALFPEEGEKITIPSEGISVRVINLHHGRDRPIQNLGFLLEMGGMTLLHIGDTEATADDFAVYDLVGEGIDLGFIPFWHLTADEYRGGVRDAIRPDRIVVMHLPAPENPGEYIEGLGGWDAAVGMIKKEYPGAIVFRRSMETRRIGGPKTGSAARAESVPAGVRGRREE